MLHNVIDLLRTTESVAIEASRWVGLGDELGLADAAAKQMRMSLEYLHTGGTIRIGDEFENLQDGTDLGDADGLQLCLRTVEGITATSLGGTNTLSLAAAATGDDFPTIPRGLYMEKVVVPSWAAGQIDYQGDTLTILNKLAETKGVRTSELRVVLLDRPRNQATLEAIRDAGARATLIPDGDVAVSLAILAGGSPYDCLLGSGGAREAVFTAIASIAVGDAFFGRFLVRTRDEQEALYAAGMPDENVRNGFTASDLAPPSSVLSATAITESQPLLGVRVDQGRIFTDSLLFRGETGTIRTIRSSHLRSSAFDEQRHFVPDATLNIP